MTHIPKDIRKSLEESGVKFDDEGNVIEDDFFNNVVDDDDDLDDDDDNVDDLDDNTDDVDDDDDLDDDDDDDNLDEDDDDDDVVQKSKTKKKTQASWSNDLTPKSKKTNSETDNTSEVLKRIEALQAQIQGNSNDVDDDQDDPNQKLLMKLQEEARNFEKMTMKRLASELSREVNRRFEKFQVNYNEVIRSQEWDDFLDSKVYGRSIGDSYQQAIKNQDLETMISVFDDFAERHFKVKEENKSTKKDIADLAVPESSKAKRSVKKRSKYDYNASDYGTNLNLMERGKMSPDDFYQFEAKYEKAEKEGRVNSAK